MALKRLHPDLEIKLSEILKQMPRPLSAPSTPSHSRPTSPTKSDDDSEQEEHENLAWHADHK